MALKKLSIQLSASNTLRDQAYNVLKEAIISGTLEPGERLVEQQIADSLGLSRNPVREAFRRLEQEGYLIVTRMGILVRGVSVQELHDLYAVRVRLEGMAAALVAERATPEDVACLRQMLDDMESLVEEADDHKLTQASFEFHSKIYSLLQNRFLLDTLTSLTEQTQRYRSLQYKIPHRGQQSVDEDRLIVEAIARHDVQAADRYAQEHISRLWAHAQAIAESVDASQNNSATEQTKQVA